MKEYTLWLPFLIGILFLFFRDFEKLRWLGGNKEEAAPIKDGTFWLYFLCTFLILPIIIGQLLFLIDLSRTQPDLMILYYHQFFGIVLLFVLLFIFLIKGFINPTLNFIIALICNIIITISFLLLNILSYSFYLSPLMGLIGGRIIQIILQKKFDSGNKILWEIPKVWKVINNRYFLLTFTVIFIIEMILQQIQLSITTVWFFL